MGRPFAWGPDRNEEHVIENFGKGCNWTQVWLPAASKASTQDTSLVKRRVVYFRCRQPGRWGLLSQSPSSHLSGCRGFDQEGEGNKTKRSRVGVEVFTVQTSTVHSNKTVMAQCASSRFSHPGFTSSWLHSGRSANLPKLGWLKVWVCILWS